MPKLNAHFLVNVFILPFVALVPVTKPVPGSLYWTSTESSYIFNVDQAKNVCIFSFLVLCMN